MAKATIVIEDSGGGMDVSFVFTPSLPAEGDPKDPRTPAQNLAVSLARLLGTQADDIKVDGKRVL